LFFFYKKKKGAAYWAAPLHDDYGKTILPRTTWNTSGSF